MISSLLVSIEILLILTMLIFIFLCSLGEATLVAVNRGRLRAYIHQQRFQNAREVWEFLNDRSNLSSLLVGITLLILLTSALTTHFVEMRWHGWGEIAGLGMAVFILTFCEVLPKSIGAVRAEALLVRWIRLWKFLAKFFQPINSLVYSLASKTLQLMGLNPNRQPNLSVEEFLALLETGVESKVIEPEEFLLAERVLRLEEISVRDIMVARPDIVALPVDSSLDDVMQTVMTTGHSRIPLYEENLDNIVGVIYAYDILAKIADGERAIQPKVVARAPYFVPETKPVSELLQEMRTNQMHVAIVLDEHGATAGLVTLEDIVEEIVGELRDEHDREAELGLQIDERTFIVDARMDRRQFEELTAIDLPEGDFSTVGGFVFSALGRLPSIGEKVVTPDAIFIVEEIQRRRITKVRIILRSQLEKEQFHDQTADVETQG
ncbi:MAG: hemolysin family protein [Armatimonadetes bacterium]|nr:hemolysin family protein [Armatimonadota bacterium]MDW8026755.1 hemolysin family protein [Armatimonadota bacterium]